MIRIRVEVLATKPIIVRAEISKSWEGIPLSAQGELGFVQHAVMRWIGEYALFVRNTADELVPR